MKDEWLNALHCTAVFTPGKLQICLRHEIQNVSVYQQPRLATLKLTEQDNIDLILIYRWYSYILPISFSIIFLSSFEQLR